MPRLDKDLADSGDPGLNETVPRNTASYLLYDIDLEIDLPLSILALRKPLSDPFKHFQRILGHCAHRKLFHAHRL